MKQREYWRAAFNNYFSPYNAAWRAVPHADHATTMLQLRNVYTFGATLLWNYSH